MFAPDIEPLVLKNWLRRLWIRLAALCPYQWGVARFRVGVKSPDEVAAFRVTVSDRLVRLSQSNVLAVPAHVCPTFGLSLITESF